MQREDLDLQTKDKLQSDDRFLKMGMMKLPDLGEAIDRVNGKGCEYGCLTRCDCVAYAHVEGIGCLVWIGDSVDIQKLSSGGEELYIRLPLPQNSEYFSFPSFIRCEKILYLN